MFGCICLDSNVGPGENVDRGPLHTFFSSSTAPVFVLGGGVVYKIIEVSRLRRYLSSKKKKVCAPLYRTARVGFISNVSSAFVFPRGVRDACYDDGRVVIAL